MDDRPMDDTTSDETAGGEPAGPGDDQTGGDTTEDPAVGDETVGGDPAQALPPPAATTRSWWHWPVARDPDDGKLSGVVAGLSRAYGFDLRTTRIAVVLASLVLPAVVLLYIAAWILLPPRPEQAVPLREVVLDRRRLPLMVAIGIVIVVGGLGSFGSWFVFGGLPWGLPWGLALIAVGVMLWAAPRFGSGAARTTPRTPDSAAPGSTAWSSPTASGPARTSAPYGRSPFGTVPFTAAGSTTQTPTTPTPTTPVPTTRPMGLPPRPPAPATPRPPKVPIARFALLGAVLLAGLAAIGDAFGWWNLSVFALTVLSIAIVMLGVVASAIVNRSWALIPFFVLLIPPMVFLLITQPNLDGGAGKRREVPATIAEAEQSRSLGAGRLTIDLTQVPSGGGTVATSADVGYGRLAVIVPDDAEIVLATEVGAGHVLVDGREIVSGLRQSDSRTIRTEASDAVPEAQRRIFDLDLEVGGGEIAVIRSAAR